MSSKKQSSTLGSKGSYQMIPTPPNTPGGPTRLVHPRSIPNTPTRASLLAARVLTRDFYLAQARKHHPDLSPANDFEILMLGSYPLEDIPTSEAKLAWLRTAWQEAVEEAGSATKVLSDCAEILNRYVEPTGIKPSPGDPDLKYISLPWSKYSLRFWPGSLSAAEYCMDFVLTDTRMPVNVPAGYQFWATNDPETPWILPISEGMELKSIEKIHGIPPEKIRSGAEKFILRDGMLCYLTYKDPDSRDGGSEAVYFRVPKRPEFCGVGRENRILEAHHPTGQWANMVALAPTLTCNVSCQEELPSHRTSAILICCASSSVSRSAAHADEPPGQREFTLQLLPVLERKLRRTIPALLAHSPILAWHTIYQALAFDTALKDEGFDLPGTTAVSAEDTEKHWDGVSEVILGKKEWFEAWVEGERKSTVAMDQYFEIISAPDAWLIADEEEDADGDVRVAERELKPTNSARRVKALVEQVTDRYSPLPQYSQRTRFLIGVQLPLLESYHARISSSLDAFETLSSTLMRAVPGALGAGDGRSGDSRRLTAGVEGVQRLCKALVSAQYVANAMEVWGEDLFFLELWAEINRRANLRTKAESVPSLPNPNASEDEPLEGTIFEELVRHYQALVGRAEDMIVQCVTGEIESGLKPHLQGASAQSSPESGVDGSDDIALAQTLLAPLALVSSHLTFLRGTLPRTTTTSLYRRIASQLSTHLLQRQVLFRGRSRASVSEGKAVLAEAELWVETARAALKTERGRVEAPWRAYLQAARLLAGEGKEWDRVVEATFGTMADTEWEEVMLESVGLCELPREEVQQVLRRREDCDR
ncbi:TIP-1 family-domain-containing protein [Trametes polyzona]|nr:TIP-1 family-domain-containing protein [Trametes polyzona]